MSFNTLQSFKGFESLLLFFLMVSKCHVQYSSRKGLNWVWLLGSLICVDLLSSNELKVLYILLPSAHYAHQRLLNSSMQQCKCTSQIHTHNVYCQVFIYGWVNWSTILEEWILLRDFRHQKLAIWQGSNPWSCELMRVHAPNHSAKGHDLIEAKSIYSSTAKLCPFLPIKTTYWPTCAFCFEVT